LLKPAPSAPAKAPNTDSCALAAVISLAWVDTGCAVLALTILLILPRPSAAKSPTA
jgi:hypothetical protein